MDGGRGFIVCPLHSAKNNGNRFALKEGMLHYQCVFKVVDQTKHYF